MIATHPFGRFGLFSHVARIAAVTGVLFAVSTATAIDLPIPVEEPEREGEVDFHSEVMPLLRRSCLACHNAKLAESGLDLETVAKMIEGGDSGTALVPGDVAASLLLTRATGEEEPLMPPEDNSAGANPLTSQELGLISLWIRQGAKVGDPKPTDAPSWQRIPASFQPIYAIDASPDGHYFAAGRGSSVAVHEVAGLAEVARLVDPNLPESAGENATDIDLVQAIAFSPDGSRIATGGYRSVKLWSKHHPELDLTAGPWAGGVGPAAAAGGDSPIRAVALPDLSIRVFDMASGETKVTILGHRLPLVGLALSAAGDRLVSLDVGGNVMLWDAASGQALARIELTRTVESLAAAADLSRIAVLDGLGSIHLLQVTAGETTSIAPYAAEAAAAIEGVTSIAWVEAEPPLLVVATEAASVQVLDATQGSVVKSIDAGSVVESMAVAQATKQLATAGRDGQIKIWDVASGELKRTLRGDPRNVRLATASASDVQRQQGVLTRLTAAGEDLKKRLENEEAAVTKATETRDTAAEAVKEPTQKFADAEAALKQSETKIAELEKQIPALKGMIEETEAKQKAAEEAAAKAKAEAEKAAAEKAAAEKAAAEKAAAEKAAAEAAAAEKAAAEKAEAEKAAADEAAADAAENADAAGEEPGDAADSPEPATPGDEPAADEQPEEAPPADEKPADEKPADEKPADEKPLEVQLAEAVAGMKAQLEKAEAELKTLTDGLEEQKKAVAAAKEAKDKADAELVKTQQALDAGIEARDRLVGLIGDHDARVADETRQSTALTRRQERLTRDFPEYVSPVDALTFSPAGDTLASFHRDGVVRVYVGEETGARSVLSAATSETLGDIAPQLVFSDAESLLLFSSTVGPQGWKLKPTWNLTLQIGNPLDAAAESPISDRVTAIDFHPDGRMIAVGSGPPSRAGEVLLFSTVDGSLIREWSNIHSDTVLAVQFSPDGRRLASSAADKIVRIIDPARDSVLRSLEGHTHHVLSIAWHDDAATLASASADKTIKVWDADTGTQKRTIPGIGKEAAAIRFVGQTGQVLTAGADGSVRLHETGDGKSIRAFAAAGDFLFSVAVTPDGGIVFSGGQEGILRAWKVADGAVVAELKPE